MTTLAAGSSVTLSLGDGGSVVVASNGGFASVTVAPLVGSATTDSLGPAPVRKVYGPLLEGGTVVVTNASAALDYDFNGGAIGIDKTAAAALTGTLVTGLVANDTSAATAQANAAQIQAALNSKGNVFLAVPAGDYSINVANPSAASQILSIASDTFLDSNAGVNLLGPSTAASACLPLIANANWRSNKFSVTSITASTGSAPYVTTATARIPGHTFTVGKYILFKGCTLGSRVYNNVWKVASVGSPTADDLTFQMFGFSAAPSSATGTVIAYPADSNIRIGPGLTFDANLNTNSTGTLGEVGKHCSIFNKIRELNVSARFRRAAKFGLHFCNAFDTVFDLGRFEQTSDGIHGLGPLQGCRITGVRGATGDDPCAFTGNNTGYTQYDLKDLDGTKNSDGEMTDVFIQAQSIATGGSRTILISAGANAGAKRFTVQSVQRATAAAGLYALLETPTGETGNYEDITFDGLFGDAPAGNSLLFGASIAGTTTNIKNLVVRNIGSHGSDISGTPTAFSGNVISFGNGALNITGMTIDGVGIDADLTNAAANVNLLVFGSGSGVHNIKGLSVSNVKMFSSGSTRSMQGVIIGSNGTYDRITLTNVYGKGNGWTFVGDQSTQSGTGKLLLTNCTGDGNSIGGQAVIASAGGRSVDILLNNVTHENAANHMIYVYGGSSKTFDIRANNCKVSNKFFDMSAHTSPTVNVRMSGCSSDNFTVQGGSLVAGFGAGSPVWTFYGNCSDIGLNVASIVSNDTTVIYNTNAATVPGVGLVASDGTNWRRVNVKPQVVTFSTTPALDCNLGNSVTLSTTLTNNITWGAPTNIPAAGERVTVTMTQDGTGGRTVAWNAAYVFPTAWTNTGNTLGKKSSVTFVSDGAALVAQGVNSWY